MKRIPLMLAITAVLIAIVCLYTRCTKPNTDQPCGTYGSNEQLFRDGNDNCYYTDNSSGKKVSVDKSNCTCF